MNKKIFLIAFLAFIIAFSGLVNAQDEESDVYSMLRRRAQAQARTQTTLPPTRPTKPTRTNGRSRPSNLESRRSGTTPRPAASNSKNRRTRRPSQNSRRKN